MPPKKPSTYMGFIEAAILAQKEAEGSSRQAMTKYILANFGKSDATSFKRALKKGVSSGKLVANGARFKLAGVDFEPAQVDRVEIKDVSEGEGRAAESGDRGRSARRGPRGGNRGPRWALRGTRFVGCGLSAKGPDLRGAAREGRHEGDDL